MILAATPPPPPFEASVLKVSDGDTIVVMVPGNPKKMTIRLACIDGPESDQPGGGSSIANMRSLLPPGTVVEIEPVTPNDRYGRTVAFVKKNDSKGVLNINLAQVSAGHAWVYTAYIRTCPQYAEALNSAQAEAKLNKFGFWGEQFEPCTPWNWRSNKCGALPDCKPIENLEP
jgi:endonuclease YncB( thermonuclease family)